MTLRKGVAHGLKLVVTTDDHGDRHLHYRCYHCGWHAVSLDKPAMCDGVQHTWDEEVVAPTVSPAIIVAPEGPGRCHHYITGGFIQYMSDSQHVLSGLTLPLPDYDA